MTRADHVIGSDRIFEALGQLDPAAHGEIVVNVQGDLPTVDPAERARRAGAARRPGRRHRHHRRRDRARRRSGPIPNVVKVVGTPVGADAACARSISPAPPRPGATGRSITTSASTPIAARRSSASSRLPPSPLEQREQLEQLRALEAGMRIDVGDRRCGAARRRHARRPRSARARDALASTAPPRYEPSP